VLKVKRVRAAGADVSIKGFDMAATGSGSAKESCGHFGHTDCVPGGKTKKLAVDVSASYRSAQDGFKLFHITYLICWSDISVSTPYVQYARLRRVKQVSVDADFST
jgi:hypothetical protein